MNGSIGWIARQVRAEYSYAYSTIQSTLQSATVGDLNAANNIVNELKDTAEARLFFRSDVDWDDVILVTICDASFAQDQYVDVTQQGESFIHNRRSQFGRIHLLVESAIWEAYTDVGAMPSEDFKAYFISWKSGIIRRVCRSTFRSESIGMTNAIEAGDHLRAAITEIKKQRFHPPTVGKARTINDAASMVDRL